MSGPELKEFLYVDVDRVRSLLAQMAGGVIEEIRSASSTDAKGAAQATLFGIGGSGEYSKGTQYEESRSLQDYTFVAFERLANENRLITELDSSFSEPVEWETGSAHAKLRHGQLIRVECEIQLLDGSFFESRVKRLVQLTEAIVDMNPLPVPSNASQRVRSQVRSQLVATMMGGVPSSQLEAISAAVNAFIGDSISLRVLPCGSEFLQFGFIGALLGRREYIQEERENLFSRYGQSPATWTCVLQIAAIPGAPDSEQVMSTGTPEVPSDEAGPERGDETTPNESQAEADRSPDLINPDGNIDRAAMEKLAGGVLEYMEAVGIVEGPRWPSVSVTPLGIYRAVPKAS